MEMNTCQSPVEDTFEDYSLEVDEDHQATMASAIPSIKLEDHGAPSTITPDLLSIDTPPPESSHTSSKGVKKRKSWGQVLPEPKTSLPPRKRAKTADEKEQRRIERVKRNRLAAHNSRERKREEMEKLQLKNDALKDRMLQMQKQMEAMAQELKAFRSGSTPAVSAFDFASIPEIPASMLSPPMTATASSTLQTPELGNLDSPRSELNDDFSVPATPTDAAIVVRPAVSFTGDLSLTPALFQPATPPRQSKPQPDPATTTGNTDAGVGDAPHLLPQHAPLPLDYLDNFLNFDHVEPLPQALPNNPSPDFDLIDDSSPPHFGDLLDDGASASSDFLDIITAADHGAPAQGSDGSGRAVEEGAYAQLFEDTIAL